MLVDNLSGLMNDESLARLLQTVARLVADQRLTPNVGQLDRTQLDEARSFVRSLLHEVRRRVNVGATLDKIWTETDYDTEAFQRLRESLDKIIESFPVELAAKGSELRSRVDLLDTFVTNPKTFDPLEIALRFEMAVEPAVTDILMHVASANRDAAEIRVMLREKLDLVTTHQVALIWAKITQEFVPRKDWPSLTPFEHLLPSGFFSPNGDAEMRDRVADYAVHLRPAVIAQMLASGATRLPMTPVPLVRIVGIRKTTDSLRVSDEDRDLIHALIKLSVVWVDYLRELDTSFLPELGVAHRPGLLEAKQCKDFLQHWTSIKDKPSAFGLVCDHVVDALKSFLSRTSPVEQVLRRYKLSLEAALPDTGVELSSIAHTSSGELHLQRHLCRFMIEHGVYAVGTRFGRAQVDLMSTDGHADYLIEAKLFREDDWPTDGAVREYFQQLQSYMQTTRLRPFGILLIFNFSKCPINAEQVWFSDRYWILPVNLADMTPSDIKATLNITRANDATVVFDAVPSGKRPRKRQSKKKKKVNTIAKASKTTAKAPKKAAKAPKKAAKAPKKAAKAPRNAANAPRKRATRRE